MPDPTAMSGRILARYRIDEEVGRGGMAVVYRGLDSELGREVAIKVLHPHLASQAESRARLQREAQAVAKLQHENILEIYDYSGADSTESFLVTEFIHGTTLTAFLARHKIPLPDVAAMIVVEMTRALEHAHRFGVIHRDVKPENVMIRSDGRIKITDFGIAQIIDKERLTATGQLIGSPAYMSPELVMGGQIDFRTDVFAVGVVLYQLAVGSLPFAGRNPHEVMKKIVEARFIPAEQANPMVGAGLSRIISRALAKTPETRHQDMTSLRTELSAELALAGINEARPELTAFFADPDHWAATARPRLVAALVENGRKEAARGKSAAALALAGRALLLSPDDAAARSLLKKISRRRSVSRVSVGIGALALASVGVAVVSARSRRVEPILAGPAPISDGAKPATVEKAIDPKASPVRTIPPRMHERPRVVPRPVIAVEPPRPALRDVRINVLPKNVEIFVDGRSIGDWDPGKPTQVTPGAHDVEFRNPSCYPKKLHLGADDVMLPDVRLAWRDATLTLRAAQEGTNVQIAPKHRPARVLSVSGTLNTLIVIPPESFDSREAVHLSASAKGYATREFDLEVQAGAHIEQSIDLPRAR